MEAKHLAIITQSDDCWEKLADEYQLFDLDSFVERARIIAPHIFYESPEIGEIEGEIQNEDGKFILTWEDGMDECMRILPEVMTHFEKAVLCMYERKQERL